MSQAEENGKAPISISLAMIVKNEEKTIERCLLSIKDLVEEIIIVDTGSTDCTKQIVANYTTKIYDFVWVNDFAAARNYAFSLATQEYILWLDADDVFLTEDQEKFSRLKASLTSDVTAVSMLYNLLVNEHGQVTSQLRRNRLVKKECQFRWIGAVHEYLEVYGNIINSDAAVTHQPLEHDANRNLHIYEQRQQRGEQFSPRDLFYFANELLDHSLYNRAIEYYQQFLATRQGWVEDNIAACGKIADCFYNLHDSENQLKYIFHSFTYDQPRADFCCRLGYHFLNLNKLDQAIFWYTLATQLKKPEAWSLTNNSCWTWLPHLQLCVCYYRTGDYVRSKEHNEKAAKFIPKDSHILHNRQLLRNLLGK